VVRRSHEDAERELGRIESDLYDRVAEYVVPKRIKLAELRAALPPDTTLLDFTMVRRQGGERHHLAFVVNGTGPVTFADLGPARVHDPLLGELSPDPRNPAGREPRVPQIFDGSERLATNLLIAPTGRWAMAPFAMFPGADGRPLSACHRPGPDGSRIAVSLGRYSWADRLPAELSRSRSRSLLT
jgi:hypothetical protein